VARHGGGDMHEPALKRQRFIPFRDVFGEIATKHLGTASLKTVFPGYAGTSAKFRGVLG